jgi:hypothetical protein
MSQFVSAMRAVATGALVAGYAWIGPATAAADPNSDALAKMLSQGYTTSNCTTTQGTSGVLAVYQCGQNPLPNGPTKAVYFLFDNAGDTSAGFQGAIADLAVTPCKSGDPAPDTWSFDNSSNSTAGQVACGTGKTDHKPGLVWTNDQNHMVGGITGSDVASLYQWWQTNG